MNSTAVTRTAVETIKAEREALASRAAARAVVAFRVTSVRAVRDQVRTAWMLELVNRVAA